MFQTIKTFLLMFILGLIFLAVGSFFGQIGLKIAFIMAVLMNGIMYFFSDKIVLKMSRAKPLDEHTYKPIFEMVTVLADRMHMPRPKLWLIDSKAPNAFATGRNPSHASVALTTGIIDILDEHELEGVLAHELSHVKNRDILISTFAATFATAIGYLAFWLRSSALWGSRKQNNNPMLMLIVGITLPFIATLVQLAISRSREYQADTSGSQATHDPLALASALKKLEQHTQWSKKQTQKQFGVANPLNIAHPVTGKKFIDMFSTHPPMNKRIKRLEELHQKMF